MPCVFMFELVLRPCASFLGVDMDTGYVQSKPSLRRVYGQVFLNMLIYIYIYIYINTQQRGWETILSLGKQVIQVDGFNSLTSCKCKYHKTPNRYIYI